MKFDTSGPSQFWLTLNYSNFISKQVSVINTFSLSPWVIFSGQTTLKRCVDLQNHSKTLKKTRLGKGKIVYIGLTGERNHILMASIWFTFRI